LKFAKTHVISKLFGSFTQSPLGRSWEGKGVKDRRGKKGKEEEGEEEGEERCGGEG
jgi:hypothetical protein